MLVLIKEVHLVGIINSVRQLPIKVQFLFYFVQQPPGGQGLLILEDSRSHTTTHHSRQDSSGVISSSQRPLSDNTHNRHPRPQRDSNPQFQKASGRRPMPQTARPLEPTIKQSSNINNNVFISIIGRTHFYHLRYPCTTRLPSSLVCSALSLEVRQNSVSVHALQNYFTYLHVLQFIGNSQNKIYDTSFIILSEEDVVLTL